MDDDDDSAWAHQQELEQQEFEGDEMLQRMEQHAKDFRQWLEWQLNQGEIHDYQ